MTECYECSRLAELVAQNTAMRAKLGADAPEKPVGALGRLADADDALAPENGVSAGGVEADDGNAFPSSTVGSTVGSAVDTREKLEADVRKHYSHTTSTLMYPPSANKRTDWLASMPIDTVFGWLDRQAAITANEANHIHEFGCEACRAAQKREIAELEAENARLREAVGDFCAELQMGLDALKGKAAAIKGSL